MPIKGGKKVKKEREPRRENKERNKEGKVRLRKKLKKEGTRGKKKWGEKAEKRKIERKRD